MLTEAEDLHTIQGEYQMLMYQYLQWLTRIITRRVHRGKRRDFMVPHTKLAQEFWPRGDMALPLVLSGLRASSPLGNIEKSRRARGDAKSGDGEGPSPVSPKLESLLAGYPEQSGNSLRNYAIYGKRKRRNKDLRSHLGIQLESSHTEGPPITS